MTKQEQILPPLPGADQGGLLVRPPPPSPWPFKEETGPPLKLFGRKTMFSVCVPNNNVIAYYPNRSLLSRRYSSQYSS